MPGIALNEDNSHFFFTRAGQTLDTAAVAQWVDQYAGTQVRELLLCPNCMRTSYASEAWEPIWHGYDPEGPDDQPLLASTAPEQRAGARGWIHTAWALAQQGIDVYQTWIDRARQHGLSPWLSMRMNDIHNVDDERSYIHGEFWRSRPDLRRVPYRFAAWQDRAFDYGQPEVRAHHLRLIDELLARYDMDGLELDWMRFGYHFRPGHEAEGAAALTDFTAEVRARIDRWEAQRGHRIRLGARVPSRPETARRLGMDAVTWAHRGLIDWLVVTPFWASIEPDMPLELWRALLEGTGVTLCAGLEVLVRPSPGYPEHPMNSLQSARGAAAALLARGADRVYLFNYMDSETAMDDVDRAYPALLREVGSLETLAGTARRHILTFSDTWAPGEPEGYPLPATCAPGQWRTFRLPVGPRPDRAATLVLGLTSAAPLAADACTVRLNGVPCAWHGAVTPDAPAPLEPTYAWDIPPEALHGGDAVIELQAHQAMTVQWVEVAIAGTTTPGAS